jgi:hypothetical protein
MGDEYSHAEGAVRLSIRDKVVLSLCMDARGIEPAHLAYRDQLGVHISTRSPLRDAAVSLRQRGLLASLGGTYWLTPEGHRVVATVFAS